MGDEWEISIWVPVEVGSEVYEDKKIASGNDGWKQMQDALFEAREYHRPITMVWRGDARSFMTEE